MPTYNSFCPMSNWPFDTSPARFQNPIEMPFFHTKNEKGKKCEKYSKNQSNRNSNYEWEIETRNTKEVTCKMVRRRQRSGIQTRRRTIQSSIGTDILNRRYVCPVRELSVAYFYDPLRNGEHSSVVFGFTMYINAFEWPTRRTTVLVSHSNPNNVTN